MQTQKSAGFIVFRRDGKAIEYLLLHHGSDYWNFPKGRLESGETEEEAAFRELEEETGIKDITMIKGFRDQYDYDFDSVIDGKVREKIFKTAVFFLGEVKNKDVKISDEHTDHGWFDFETAGQRLFYQNGQDLLKRAHSFLLKQSDFVL